MSARYSGHLGHLAAALVDGELDHTARDRALVHLASCVECRAEVDAQRRTKARLRRLADAPPGEELRDRLAALPQRRPGPADVVPRRPRHHARRRARRWAVVSGATLVAGSFVGAFAVGGDDAGHAVTPPVDTYVVQHVATTDQLPLSDPGSGAATVTVANVTGR